VSDLAQVQDPIDPPQEVIRRNVILKAEVVEKPTLIPLQPPHHLPALPRIRRKTESRLQTRSKTDFINGIDPKQTPVAWRARGIGAIPAN
jgi:hypothetical protein